VHTTVAPPGTARSCTAGEPRKNPPAAPPGPTTPKGAAAALELLQRTGPATVPDIARRRYVTRQHIQTPVNALLAQGLVAAEANPAHRRSPRIALTADGRRMIRRITDRERRFLAGLDLSLNPQELLSARRTLTMLRNAIGAAHEQAS